MEAFLPIAPIEQRSSAALSASLRRLVPPHCPSLSLAYRSRRAFHTLLCAAGGHASSTPATAPPPSSATVSPKYALLFDCDGVIVLTEDLHRQAYNASFAAFDLRIGGEPVRWDVKYYDVLQNTVGGGKPKMEYHFGRAGWPDGAPADIEGRKRLIDALQDKKTEVYKIIVEQAAETRPGVKSIMEEALKHPEIAVGICSASTKEGFEKVVDSVLGREMLDRFDLIIAGDDVEKKKPHPEIYNTARERAERMSEMRALPAERCLVIEDSVVGLKAAKAAGMKCVITYTESTADQDFGQYGADLVLESLEDITLKDLFTKVFGPVEVDLS